MRRKDEYLERLRRVPMFTTLTDKQLRLLSEQADDLSVQPGRVLVRQGQIGEEFFFILSGKVSIKADGKEVDTAGAGDYFGELALLDPGPRDATVEAVEPTELLVITGQRFRRLLDDVPELSRHLLQGMARRLRDADKRRAYQ